MQGDDNAYITALIYVQNSLMPHQAVIQLMRVIKWPRSDSDRSCGNKNVRGNKGFYSIIRVVNLLQKISHFKIKITENSN